MSARTFDDPKLALNRIYTKRGDRGETSLVNGRRVPKDDLKIDAYGTVDELNAYVGRSLALAQESTAECEPLNKICDILVRVQHELFNLGSILATDPQDVHPKQPQITDVDVKQLESEIDEMNADLEPLRSFVLPGGSLLNTELHVCRTVCRRAERICTALGRREKVPPAALRYLNRLSDAFFVWSRWVCLKTGAPEVLWEPNEAASGSK